MMVYKELYRRCVNSFGEDKFGMKMHHIGNFENLPKIVYVCRVIFLFLYLKTCVGRDNQSMGSLKDTECSSSYSKKWAWLETSPNRWENIMLH